MSNSLPISVLAGIAQIYRRIAGILVGPVLPSSLAITVLLCACTAAPSPSVAVDAKKVLILAPQGVSAAKDTVGFNELVRKITQAFSPALSKQLTAKGYSSVNVIDQESGLDVGQKMALYAARNAAAKVAVVTVETNTVGSDDQLQLRVQFIEGELIPSNSAPKGLRTRTTIEKTYVLRGSQSGDTKRTLTELATDFVDFLQASGRLKN